jgi:hypothetical protein
VLQSIQEALVYAEVSGAFFREWDTLDMALHLVRRLGSRREALEDLALGQYLPFLKALLALLEKKDLCTARDHSLRVSWLAGLPDRPYAAEDSPPVCPVCVSPRPGRDWFATRCGQTLSPQDSSGPPEPLYG